MSKVPRVIVEGETDRLALYALYDLAWKSNIDRFFVDTVSSVRDYGLDTLGNREKVEAICEAFLRLGESHVHVAGLADREYRETSEYDARGDHATPLPNLVWTRGHSIENYLLHPDICQSAFSSVMRISNFTSAIKLFRNSFDTTLKVVCALGLSAHRSAYSWKAVAGAIGEECFVLNHATKSLVFDAMQWKSNLVSKINLTNSIADQLHAGFEEALRELEAEEPDWIRDTCHGHLAIKAIRFAYIVAASFCEEEAQTVVAIRGISEENMLRALFAAWATMVKEHGFSSPRAVAEIATGAV